MAKQQHKQKHVAMRSCVVCRQKVDKRTLTRIVRTPEKRIQIDLTGKQNGRGAYLCTNSICWERAVERKVLDRALKTDLATTERELILAFRHSAESQHV